MKFIEEDPIKRRLRQMMIKWSCYDVPNKNQLAKYIEENNILNLEIIEYGLKFIIELRNKRDLKYPDIKFEDDEINIKSDTMAIMLSIIYNKSKEIKDATHKVKLYVEENKSEIKKVKIK